MKICHKWTIKRFGHLYFEKDDKCKLSFVQSDAFPPETKAFFLRLYPRAVHKQYEDYVSISLHFLENDHSQIDYKLAIVNRFDQICNPKGETNVTSCKNEFTLDKFITHADLSDLRNGYLPKEILTIHCEIEYLKNQTQCYESNGESNAEVEVTRLQNQWEIKEFELCRKFALQNNIVISSDDLCHENAVNKFFLRVWPTGRGNTEGHLAIYIYPLNNSNNNSTSSNQDGVESAQYKISLINGQSEKCFTKLNQETIIGGNEFGCHKYISLSELLNASNHLLTDDILKIYCEVDLIGGEMNKTVEKVKKEHFDWCGSSITNLNLTNSNNVVMNVNSQPTSDNISMSNINPIPSEKTIEYSDNNERDGRSPTRCCF